MIIKRVRARRLPTVFIKDPLTNNVSYAISGYNGRYENLNEAVKEAEKLNKRTDILKIKRIDCLAEIEEKMCTVQPESMKGE